MAKSKSKYPVAQNPLLLRFHRLMDAFAKSDDERDFYLDTVEGFLLFANLNKPKNELAELEKEISENPERYHLVPKMTFYETKKFMEGFINEKVYDIDTKEKLSDIIQSKEARENFLEFIYDHLTELEKWQQYYVERSRIRIIEWLRNEEIVFVFEEDMDLGKNILEKLKTNLFKAKVPKEVSAARDALKTKSKVYYSSEALNPRPKRGRPPKQAAKVEHEPQVTVDLFTTVPSSVLPFLFLPEITSAAAVTFSSRYDTEADLLASLRGSTRVKVDERLQALSERLESLRHLSARLVGVEGIPGIEKEKKMMKAVSVTEDPMGEEKSSKGGILQVVSGFLPKRRKGLVASKGAPKKAGKRVIKTVTQLKKKRGNK